MSKTDCKSYEFTKIEPHWQKFWEDNKTFQAVDNDEKPKYYALDMFPYPSGAGLHIGHPEGYTASDILARYKKANGYNVLHPMGWDAFGLPAEQYAVKTGTHPAITTKTNVENFRRQIQRFGFSIDWEREINTTDPIYFRWTQWIFLQLFKHGLAFVDERPVWWCPNFAQSWPTKKWWTARVKSATTLSNAATRNSSSASRPTPTNSSKAWMASTT